MKHLFKVILLFVLISVNLFLVTACWNYQEIEKLSIVAGAAIDKEGDQYLLTVEIVNLGEGKDTKLESKKIEIRGDTIFDAARNAIKITGKKLYWSHLKVIILSQDVAREGIIQAIDWFHRDEETRMETNMLVSKEKTAKELLEQQSVTSEIRSFEMYDMLCAEKSVSKAAAVEV